MSRGPLFDLEQARGMHAAGFSFYRIAALLGVEVSSIRYWLDAGAREAHTQRNRRWQEDQRRPGVIVTLANADRSRVVTVARNGPGGAEANLLALLDATPLEFSVVCISTPRSIVRDLKGGGSPVFEAVLLGRIERVGRLHRDLWPKLELDRVFYERASRRPLGKGKARSRARAGRRKAKA